MGLFDELKRRNVFRVGIAYLLLGWVVIQVTDIVGPVLKLPEWTLALFTWMFIVGFPIALFFAWAYELTPDGLKREEDVDRSQSITRNTGRKINIVVIALLVVAVVFLATNRYESDENDMPPVVAETDQGYDSIGVLPFVNMSDEASQEYFSDGIAEELLNALAKMQNLQVAARTSSFAFKGQNQDITEIGKQLNVDTILEGSVRKSGTRLRITAQLIDVDNGFHLWSETYDRELTDVFAVQDEITAAIIAALSVHFDTGESPAVAEVAETNLSAYDAYLQGRHQLRGFSTTDLRAALTSFRAATDADPEFAAAWAARALTVTLLRETAFAEGIPTAESRLLARAAIDRALAIDPDLAEAYVAEGLLHEDAYRFDEALQSLEHALEINANLAEAWTWRSRILGRFGRIRESREDILKALQLDPHNETTAILAANLLEDFYDADFFAAVEKNGSQFARVRQILLELRMTYIEPFTSESYRRIEAMPDLPPYALAGWNLYVLKELDAETLFNASRYKGEFLMWLYMSTEHWDEAQAMYDGLTPERQQADLNLEELSIMQVSQGRCEEALESLDRAHDGEIRVLGLIGPNGGRSNSNLTLNRVYCLRQLGRPDEADQVLSLVREYVDMLRENTVYGIYIVDAKLRILDGDTNAALDVLEAAHQRRESAWDDRYDPILHTIGDQPRFQSLSDEIDRGIDELRAELGMPPAEL